MFIYYCTVVMDTSRQDIKSLMKACIEDDIEAVKFIVEGARPGIDVNTTFSNYGDWPIIHQGASPLFIAACNCNLELIKYLIGKGANVNSRTSCRYEEKYDGISPLQAAVSLRREVDFIKRKIAIELLISKGADPSALNSKGTPMWQFCEVDQSDVMRLLIELGMSVVQKCPDSGITMLHYWASSANPASTSLIELLLTKGADVKALDNKGISPLYAAAIGLTSNNEPYHSPNDSSLTLLLQRSEYSLLEKINTLELAGSLLLLHEENGSSISQAFHYWNEAQDFRDSAQESIPKIPLSLHNTVPWRAAEWTTKDQLKELRHRLSADIKMQAILVAQRVLSGISSNAFSSYLWRGFVYDYFSFLSSANRNIELLDICWIMLEGARRHDPRQFHVWHLIGNATLFLIATLIKLKDNSNAVLNSEILRLSLELIIATNKSHLPMESSSSLIFSGIPTDYIDVVYNLVSMIGEMPELMNQEIKDCLKRLVQYDGRNGYKD